MNRRQPKTVAAAHRPPNPPLRVAVPALALVAAGLLGACQGPGSEDPRRPSPAAASAASPRGESGTTAAAAAPLAPQPRPWTAAFEGDALLIAAVIEVTGPPGLSAHALVQQNEAVADYTTRTEGGRLVQELVVRGRARADIRGQIDRWTLAAEQRITLVEDLGAEEVRIVARGDAYWRDAAGEERRAPVLEFSGAL